MRVLTVLWLGAVLCSAAHADSLKPLKGGWQRYYNDRFGTVADIPPDFRVYEDPPANSDGREFRGPIDARLLVYGSHVRLAESEETAASDIKGPGTTNLYTARGNRWVVHSARKGSIIGYRRSLQRCGATHTVVIEYPAALKARYDPIVTRASRSLSCRRG